MHDAHDFLRALAIVLCVAAVTTVLLLSSISMYTADTAAEHGQWKVFSVACPE